ncbi:MULTISPECIES: threonine ammonia-lyase [unclassified Haladaptatus]|uniref:threonine ammonia-lyase n=1 Tax=unclassified Haladaptatus TaxID=2622732 RepID=UPI00209BE4D7|nr:MULTISPECIES: threonine ammonia-lyase [unclassified Haladaptatus]MCO8245665.1 threonine ammonia-lyase [Haladaptatus sp. AB643]MCO8255493.1 threonine ammonia-lyase [Haladaptatus sp. AB618]
MTTNTSERLPFSAIEQAIDRLDDPSVVKRTPVERSTSLDDRTGGEVSLKMEHLQWTGSFKTRGAYNKIERDVVGTDVDRVVAASAGNHAQGVALAATELGIDSTIVMPKTAPQTKIDATRGYGGEVELVGRDFREAMNHAEDLVADGSAELIHAYDDPAIIAGQGTLGVEMYEDLPDVDTVVVPIGGGGLISGIATAFSELSPETRIVGVQATGAATVPSSLDKGMPQTLDSVDTIADGIATGGISELTLSLIDRHVDEIVTVTDSEIARAVLFLLERAKQVVEGAGAASVAAIMGEALDVEGETVMPLLCGGNLDMTMLQTVLVHALTNREQLLRLRVRIHDRPGEMQELSGIIADHGANIRNVRHDRSAPELDVGEAYLVFQVETSGTGQARNIIRSIRGHSYEVVHVNS